MSQCQKWTFLYDWIQCNKELCNLTWLRLQDWKSTTSNNQDITILYISYQIFLFASSKHTVFPFVLLNQLISLKYSIFIISLFSIWRVNFTPNLIDCDKLDQWNLTASVPASQRTADGSRKFEKCSLQSLCCYSSWTSEGETKTIKSCIISRFTEA